MNPKVRNIVGWVIAGLVTALLLFSTSGKFMNEEMIGNLTAFGLGSWITIIGIGEGISTLLFIIPQTNRLGVLLLSSHMGGAIVVHMSQTDQGDNFILQAVVLVLVWVAGYLRNPGWLFANNSAR